MAMSDDSNRPKESKGLGVIGCLRFMYQREGGGLIGMYQGVWAEMSRENEIAIAAFVLLNWFRFSLSVRSIVGAICFQAILMGTKEKIESTVALVLLGRPM